MSRYIDSQRKLEELVSDLAGSEMLAIDTEFLREKTYFAKLCLIQVNNDSIQAIIDPLACSDLTVLAPIMTDPNCVKIFHAASQDVDVLFHEIGVTPTPLFDTQVAATLLGQPLQVGYGPLVKHMTGVKLAKADSYTDWSRRPLTKNQIKYALDDVVYLPEMYKSMVEQLREQGREHWLDSEFEQLSDPSRYRTDPEEAWRRVKRISSLSRRQLGIAQQIAAWREKDAVRRNLPRKWVLADEAVIEVARKAPTSIDALHEVRGLSNKLGTKASRELLEAVRVGKEMPDDQLPQLERKPHGVPEVDGVVDLMAAVVEIRARENSVAPQVLASRDDLARLARGHRNESQLLQGWRHEMVGAELIDLLEGRIGLYLDNGAIQFVRR